MADMLAIATYNLSKKYPGSSKFAVRSIDLDIQQGEVYGFLGPNGAGKTTTIRLFMNFIQPTHGEVKILSADSVLESVSIKSAIGYLPGEVALYPKMTGRQFLEYMNSLQPPKRRDYLRSLVKLFQVELNVPIGHLSRGNRQKIGILQAFMHEPDVLVLDEPTAGLDPLMQEAFFELVRKTSGRGATLFISSHNLTEVQKICDRVGFIRAGKLVAEQTIGDLSKQSIQTYDVAFAESAPLQNLRRLPKVKITANTPHHVTIQLRGNLSPLLALLAKYKIVSIDRQDPSLEDEFLQFYRKVGKK